MQQQWPGFGWPGYPMMPMGMPGMPSFTGLSSAAVNPPPALPVASGSAIETVEHEPSSDPPEINETNIYPMIETFFSNLVVRHPNRNLDHKGWAFAANDYVYIDEVLSGLTVDDLMSGDFGFSAGNAKLLLREIDDEMHRCERTNGRKRRRVRG